MDAHAPALELSNVDAARLARRILLGNGADDAHQQQQANQEPQLMGILPALLQLKAAEHNTASNPDQQVGCPIELYCTGFGRPLDYVQGQLAQLQPAQRHYRTQVPLVVVGGVQYHSTSGIVLTTDGILRLLALDVDAIPADILPTPQQRLLIEAVMAVGAISDLIADLGKTASDRAVAKAETVDHSDIWNLTCEQLHQTGRCTSAKAASMMLSTHLKAPFWQQIFGRPITSVAKERLQRNNNKNMQRLLNSSGRTVANMNMLVGRMAVDQLNSNGGDALTPQQFRQQFKERVAPGNQQILGLLEQYGYDTAESRLEYLCNPRVLPVQMRLTRSNGRLIAKVTALE